MASQSLIVHATCVAVAGKGVLITGPSGSGKSGLALQLIAFGGQLVADDRTVLQVRAGHLIASAPPSIEGMIEARGLGILPLAHLRDVQLACCIDMSREEMARLPEPQSTTLLDIVLPTFKKVNAPHFPAAVHAYLMGKPI